MMVKIYSQKLLKPASTLIVTVLLAALTGCADSSENESLICSGKTLTGIQQTSVTVPSGATCTLEKFVFMTGGTTFTAEAGSTIQANKTLSSDSTKPAYTALFIERGAQIISNGTAAQPVVFTSAESAPAPGDWGGIIIYGRGPLPLKEDGDSTDDITGRKYGGGVRTEAADSSGSLRYTRVEYGGMSFFDPGTFINNIIEEIVDKHPLNSRLNNNTDCIATGRNCGFSESRRNQLARRASRYFNDFYLKNLSEAESGSKLQTAVSDFINGDSTELSNCNNGSGRMPASDLAECKALYAPFSEAFSELSLAGLDAAGLKSEGLENFDGLRLNAVGSATTVEYVQVYKSLDDGLKINGGNVNLRYIFVSANKSDQIEIKKAWQGSIQFLLAYVRNASSDNGTAMSVSENSGPVIYNATFIADGNKYDEIMKLRENTRLDMNNLYVTEFNDNTIDIRGASILDGIDKNTVRMRSAYFQIQASYEDSKYPHTQKGRILLGESLDGDNDASDALGDDLTCETTDTAANGYQHPTDSGEDMYDAENARCEVHLENVILEKNFGSGGAASGDLSAGENIYSNTVDYLTATDGSSFKAGTLETGLAPVDNGFFDITADFVGAVGSTDWTCSNQSCTEKWINENW